MIRPQATYGRTLGIFSGIENCVYDDCHSYTSPTVFDVLDTWQEPLKEIRAVSELMLTEILRP